MTQAAFLAARADDFVVEERDMAEFARKAAFAAVELAVDHDADGYAAAHVEVEYVAVVLGFAAGVFRIAARAGVVFKQHPDADAFFEQVAQRLFRRGEVFVAAARFGVDAARHADAQAQNLAAVDAAVGYEFFDAGADAFHALRAVLQLEREVVFLFDDVVLQVGNQKPHVVAAHVDACEVDGRIGQSEDVGAASARGFDLAQVGNDVFVDQFLHQFGDGRDADVQFLGQLRERALAVDGHVRDDVALDKAVLVGDAFEGFVFVLVEKFGQRCHSLYVLLRTVQI